VIAKTAQWQPVNFKTGAYPVQAGEPSKNLATSAVAITSAATNGATDSTEVSKSSWQSTCSAL
jgi:hypothetical protein